jgi:hypothetical protein
MRFCMEGLQGCLVCAVIVTVFAARKLVNVLQMVRAGFPGVSHTDLPLLIPESDCCRVCAISRHAPIIPQMQGRTVRAKSGSTLANNKARHRGGGLCL